MEINGLFSRTIRLTEKMLNFRSLKHNIISTNIANVDTPHYCSRDLIFKGESFRSSGREDGIKLSRTSAYHLPGKEEDLNCRGITLITRQNSQNGLNTVDIDHEMNNLAKNQLVYNALIRMVSRKLRGLRTAISEGKE